MALFLLSPTIAYLYDLHDEWTHEPMNAKTPIADLGETHRPTCASVLCLGVNRIGMSQLNQNNESIPIRKKHIAE